MHTTITVDHAMSTIPTGRTITTTCQQCDGDKRLRQPYWQHGQAKVRIVRDQPCAACSGIGTREVPETIDPRDASAQPCRVELARMKRHGDDQYLVPPNTATSAALADGRWWLRVDGMWLAVEPREPGRYCRVGQQYGLDVAGTTIEQAIFAGPR